MAHWKNVASLAWEWVIWFYSITAFILSWIYNNKIQGIGISSINQLRLPTLSANTRKFKVYIYQNELEFIKRLVRQKDHIETGGDLFGLWVDAHNVVVQFVLGPGENCRRTTTSFYQDIDYLASVGDYITKNHGLCNIGQWHSHHRLNLPRPSMGDEDTVWNNMPGLGMERYVVFIATIKESVNVNCFLFEIENETKLPVLEGEICVLDQSDSPVRNGCSALTGLVESGMEDDNSVIVDMEE
jgi:hypothetical protein